MGKAASNEPTSSFVLDMIHVTLLSFCAFSFLKEGIRSYFGTPTWQTIGVFLAGVLTTVIVIRKM